MMPNMDPKKMKKLMKRAGIKTKNLPVTKIVFVFEDKTWEFTDAQATEVNMGGQKTYQVTGTYVEGEKGPPAEDIAMVAEKTGATEEEAKEALKKTDGDIAEAIMNLKG